MSETVEVKIRLYGLDKTSNIAKEVEEKIEKAFEGKAGIVSFKHVLNEEDLEPKLTLSDIKKMFELEHKAQEMKQAAEAADRLRQVIKEYNPKDHEIKKKEKEEKQDDE